MAQPMTGMDSSLIIRSNSPISIFKEETARPMAATKSPTANQPVTDIAVSNKETSVIETPVTAAPTTEPTITAADLAALEAQRRLLDDQTKQARAVLPTPTKLDRVIAAQANRPARWVHERISLHILERMRAGQPRAEATA